MKVIIMVLILAAGCSQKVKEQSPGQSYSDLLTNGKWVLRSVIINPPINGGDTDFYAMYPDCVRDDTLFFNKDGVSTLDKGVLKCTSADSQQAFFKWKLKGDNLIMDGKSAKIKNLDDHHLYIIYSQDLNSITHNLSATYKNSR